MVAVAAMGVIVMTRRYPVHSCVGTPISWLVLEQLALDELPAARAAEVRAHLDGCDVCRRCAARVADREVALAPLVVPAGVRAEPRRPWWRRPVFAGGMAAVVAAAAVLLLWLRTGKDGQPVAQPPNWPSKRVQVKGGELALALVGERAGAVRTDPVSFRDGDRFKVMVTCPPGRRVVDVAVVQSGAVFWPLAAQTIGCGNKVVLKGAFRVDGRGAIRVCAVVGQAPGVDRKRFTLRQLRESKGVVCQTLAPEAVR